MPEHDAAEGTMDTQTDDPSPAERPGLPDVIDAEEPILLPLHRYRIDVARFRTAQQLREIIESRLAQGCLVEEHMFTEHDITPLKQKLVVVYQLLCSPKEKQLFNFKLALGELLSNATRDRQENGRPYSPERFREARIVFGIEPQDERWSDFVLYFRDTGTGFNPYTVLNPNNPENIELPNGKGLLMIGHYLSIADDAVKGEVTYLPMAESNDEDMRCSEVVLRIPARGTPSELVKKFRLHLDKINLVKRVGRR